MIRLNALLGGASRGRRPRSRINSSAEDSLPDDLTPYERDCAIGSRMIEAEERAAAVWDERGLFVHHCTALLSQKHRLSEREIKALWNECYEVVD